MTGPLAKLTLFNAITSAGKTLYEAAQGVSNLDTKRQLMDVYDTLMNLKHEASELEDENHALKEKLRFKSEEFEFKNPFYYDRRNANQPLCPKCFSVQKIGPMGELHRYANGAAYRPCLVCDNRVEVERPPHSPGIAGSPNGWMR